MCCALTQTRPAVANCGDPGCVDVKLRVSCCQGSIKGTSTPASTATAPVPPSSNNNTNNTNNTNRRHKTNLSPSTIMLVTDNRRRPLRIPKSSWWVNADLSSWSGSRAQNGLSRLAVVFRKNIITQNCLILDTRKVGSYPRV